MTGAAGAVTVWLCIGSLVFLSGGWYGLMGCGQFIPVL